MLFSSDSCTNLHSHQLHARIPIHLQPYQHLLSFISFVISHFYQSEVVLLVLTCVSMTISAIQYIFIYRLVICIYSFENFLFRSNVHSLLNYLEFILLLFYLSSFQILTIKLLSDVIVFIFPILKIVYCLLCCAEAFQFTKMHFSTVLLDFYLENSLFVPLYLKLFFLILCSSNGSFQFYVSVFIPFSVEFCN